ncbi:HWE histidine kinase domain-containing protein [Methylobacterium sp. A54F]
MARGRRRADLEAENARLRGLIPEAGSAAGAEAGDAPSGFSQGELRLLIETIPQLVWRARDDGEWTGAGPQWTAYTGQAERRALGAGWLDAVHPEDREATVRSWQEADARGSFEVLHRLRRAEDGAYRWFETRAVPLRDGDGRRVAWFGTSTDVHELRTLQERQSALVADLQHRARNLLAVIRLIVRRSAETAETVESYAAHLEGRINAITRAQSSALRDPRQGLDLRALIAEELFAHLAHEGRQAHIAGPRVLLQPRAAELFCLAIHELATNAIEHGVLMRPKGTIHVTWEIRTTPAGERLVLTWLERGGPRAAAAPLRQGFGRELLERTLRYELQAETELDFAPGGLRCIIDLPFGPRIGVRTEEP